MFTAADLFDLTQSEHARIFEGCEYAWEVLSKIQAYLKANLRPGLCNRCEGVAYVGEQVFIGEGTVVEDGALIKGPAIIEEKTSTTVLYPGQRAEVDAYLNIEVALP